jgi:hypothetical protein
MKYYTSTTQFNCGIDLHARQMYVCAVLYFYKEVLRQPLQGVDALRAKRPARQRRAPTVAETQALLQTIRDRAG